MISVNMEKAKQVGHNIRRDKRSEEFKPLDLMIAAQIPGTDFAAIEDQRQIIRDKYVAIQYMIDAATSPEDIKAALNTEI